MNFLPTVACLAVSAWFWGQTQRLLAGNVEFI